MIGPTTRAMLEAAMTAHEVAAGDTAVARRRWHEDRQDDEQWAKYIVAAAAQDYAWAVMVCVWREYERDESTGGVARSA